MRQDRCKQQIFPELLAKRIGHHDGYRIPAAALYDTNVWRPRQDPRELLLPALSPPLAGQCHDVFALRQFRHKCLFQYDHALVAYVQKNPFR